MQLSLTKILPLVILTVEASSKAFLNEENFQYTLEEREYKLIKQKIIIIATSSVAILFLLLVLLKISIEIANQSVLSLHNEKDEICQRICKELQEESEDEDINIINNKLII